MTAPSRSFRAIWRLRRFRSNDGAAAVEFALVLPILALILFGIIDYGLYFNASIQSRSGVHDAARAAAVAPSQGGDTTCDTGITAPTDITRLMGHGLTYKLAIEQFTKHFGFSDEQLEQIMGRGISDCLGWPVPEQA